MSNSAPFNTMKAIKIDSKNRTVSLVDYKEYNDIYRHVECDTFTVATDLGNGNETQESDVIYVDDNGLLTQPENFFTYEGAHQPFAGNGLVLGTDFEGESCEPMVTLEEVKNKVKFYDIREIRAMIRSGEIDF